MRRTCSGQAARDARDVAHASDDAVDDSVDVRQHQLFLALEVQVDRALADTGLGRHVVDRHLPVPVAREEDVDGIEDGLAGHGGSGDGM